jgi:Uri superfamily endonuclease
MVNTGAYVMVLQMSRETRISIGQLGEFSFAEGFYCYVGSAMGPGGLTARLARHLRHRKKPHWHVDYLLQHGVVVGIWEIQSTETLECECAQTMLSLDRAQAPIQGFGSSDCSCETHLVYFSSHPSYDTFSTQLGAQGHQFSANRRLCPRTPIA